MTLIFCLVGAGLALYAVTRTWSLHITPRAGISALRTARTGADIEPWVVGLAVVALAGTGALLATRGIVRRGLGVLLTLAGIGVLIGAIAGRAGLDVGSAGAAGTLGPIACVLGGVIITAGGRLAVRDGHRWPEMSSRYERKPAPATKAATAAPAPRTAPADVDEADAAEPADVSTPADHRAAWDALDRGDDPTI